ncbi:hypothetical protein HDU76_000318 [Blyttiomyces sp. JEL0837]|nr:hypothetical protein HDU76_000318 [Blyttiomyces sp. JEL0837]
MPKLPAHLLRFTSLSRNQNAGPTSAASTTKLNLAVPSTPSSTPTPGNTGVTSPTRAGLSPIKTAPMYLNIPAAKSSVPASANSINFGIPLASAHVGPISAPAATTTTSVAAATALLYANMPLPLPPSHLSKPQNLQQHQQQFPNRPSPLPSSHSTTPTPTTPTAALRNPMQISTAQHHQQHQQNRSLAPRSAPALPSSMSIATTSLPSSISSASAVPPSPTPSSLFPPSTPTSTTTGSSRNAAYRRSHSHLLDMLDQAAMMASQNDAAQQQSQQLNQNQNLNYPYPPPPIPSQYQNSSRTSNPQSTSRTTSLAAMSSLSSPTPTTNTTNTNKFMPTTNANGPGSSPIVSARVIGTPNTFNSASLVSSTGSLASAGSNSNGFVESGIPQDLEFLPPAAPFSG